MFKPPEWHWTAAGEIGWWFRGPWNELLLGQMVFDWTTGARRGLTTVKAGPHRIVYRVDLPEGRDLRQALPRARLSSHVPAVVPQGQGANEGEAFRGAGRDRRADHLPDRPG